MASHLLKGLVDASSKLQVKCKMIG